MAWSGVAQPKSGDSAFLPCLRVAGAGGRPLGRLPGCIVHSHRDQEGGLLSGAKGLGSAVAVGNLVTLSCGGHFKIAMCCGLVTGCVACALAEVVQALLRHCP